MTNHWWDYKPKELIETEEAQDFTRTAQSKSFVSRAMNIAKSFQKPLEPVPTEPPKEFDVGDLLKITEPTIEADRKAEEFSSRARKTVEQRLAGGIREVMPQAVEQTEMGPRLKRYEQPSPIPGEIRLPQELELAGRMAQLAMPTQFGRAVPAARKAAKTGIEAATAFEQGAREALEKAAPQVQRLATEEAGFVRMPKAAQPAVPRVPAGEVPPPEPPRPPTGGEPPPPTGEVPPYEPPLPKYAASIKLSTINRPEDVLSEIARIAEENQGFAGRRRGIRSWSDTELAASELGMTQAKLLRTPIGKTFNAEQLDMARSIYLERLDSALELSRAVRGGANSIDDLAKSTEAMHEAIALQAIYSGARTEAGRSLNILKKLSEARAAPVDRQRVLLENIIDAIGGRESAEAHASLLASLDLNNPIAVSKFLRDTMKTTFKDKAIWYWYNSVLSAPSTQIVNFAGNGVFSVANVGRRYLQAGIEKPLAAIQGRPATTTFREANAATVGFVKGIPDGMRKALYTMKTGIRLEDYDRISIEAGANLRVEPISGTLGSIIGQPLRFMAAADQLWKSIASTSELYALATRKAMGLIGDARIQRVAELIQNPTEDMVEKIASFSRYATFQDKPGSIVSSLLRMRRHDPTGILTFVSPFINTPVNLLKRSVEYGPLGLLRLKKAVPEEQSKILAEALLGSIPTTIIGIGLADGTLDITADVPRNANERDRFYQLGKQPWAIRVGDAWVPFDRFEPFALPLRALAIAYTAFRRGEPVRETEVNRILSRFADAMGGITIDQAERVLGGFVPYSALLRTVETATEPIVREKPFFGAGIIGNIPGLSTTLKPRLDVFGEPIESPRGGIGALFPVAITKAKRDPVLLELERLDVGIGFVGKTAAGHELNPDQAYEYQQLAGKTAKQFLTSAVDNPYYKRMNDIDKTEALENASRLAKSNARKSIVEDMMREAGDYNSIKPYLDIEDEIVKDFGDIGKQWKQYWYADPFRNVRTLRAEYKEQFDAIRAEINAKREWWRGNNPGKVDILRKWGIYSGQPSERELAGVR